MFEFDLAQISILAIGMPGIPELLIIMAIFLLLFGGAKLPSLMRNLGRSVNEFKTGIKEAPTESAIEDGSDKDAI
jgi:sec-independent protein translocase protein TatA